MYMNGVAIAMKEVDEMDSNGLAGNLHCVVGRDITKQSSSQLPCTLHLSSLLLFDGKVLFHVLLLIM